MKGISTRRQTNMRFSHWIKLQRRYRRTQRQWLDRPDAAIAAKLDRLSRRLHRLNRNWRLGVGTAALTAWLAAIPGGTVSAQNGSSFPNTVQLSGLSGVEGFKLLGEAEDDQSGFPVSSAGDINGDGVEDLVIGARRSDLNGDGSGTTYVVFGSAVGPEAGFPGMLSLSDLDGSDGFKVLGEAARDYSGSAVSSAGDVNGDGIDDLVVGAPFSDPNGSNSGTTYVVFGRDMGSGGSFPGMLSLSDLDGTNGFKLLGEAANDRSGDAVSSAGDLNGDGVDDLVIGANGSDLNGTSSGTTYVVFGRPVGSGLSFPATLELSDLDGDNGFKLFGEAVDDGSGTSVSNAGDVNGDGIDDLVIGAAGSDSNANNSGTTYVVFGRDADSGEPFPGTMELSGLDGGDGFKVFGEAESDYLGNLVSSAGDVNGDGVDDLVIGASYADSDSYNSGTTYVIFGRDVGASEFFPDTLELSGLDGNDGFKVQGEAREDYLGASVSSAGDVNGDGIDDLMIGARGADPNGANSGTTYMIFGRNVDAGESFPGTIELSELNGNDGFKLLGEAEGDYSGFWVSSAGDVNGDGVDDLVVGAPFSDPNGSNSGTAYVIFGRNEAPQVANALADQMANEGVAFSFALPENTFNDPEGGALTLSAALADGNPLPAWLSFNAEEGTFSGTPEREDAGTFVIRVTATDPGTLSVSEDFELTVLARPLRVTDLNETTIVYPNPTHGEVRFDGLTGSHQARIYTLAGTYVMKALVNEGVLDVSELAEGSYIISIETVGKEPLYTRILKN